MFTTKFGLNSSRNLRLVLNPEAKSSFDESDITGLDWISMNPQHSNARS